MKLDINTIGFGENNLGLQLTLLHELVHWGDSEGPDSRDSPYDESYDGNPNPDYPGDVQRQATVEVWGENIPPKYKGEKGPLVEVGLAWEAAAFGGKPVNKYDSNRLNSISKSLNIRPEIRKPRFRREEE